MARNILITILLSLIVTEGFGQKEGLLKIFVRPNESVVKVDSVTLKNTNIITVPEGNHRVRAWHKGHHLLDTVVYVMGDTVTRLVRPLELTNEYRSYLERIREIDKNKLYNRVIPLAAITGFSAYSAYLFRKMQINTWAAGKYEEDLAYMNSSNEKDGRQNLYEVHREKALLYKKKFKTMGVVTVVTNTAAVAIFIYSLKIQKPIFQEDIMLTFSPNAFSPGESQLGLTIRF